MLYAFLYSKDAYDPDCPFESLVIPLAKFSASLNEIMQSATMAIHLARRQRMFSTPNAPSNFQMASLGTDERGEQLHELRMTVQRLIKRLKTA